MAVKTNESVLPEELMKLLLNLATKWGDVLDLKTLKVHHLSGALTNEVYRISWPTKNNENVSRKVLVRMYGEGVERFFNRDEEIRTFECLSKKGQGPKLLGQFPNGRVEEFIHSRTLSADDLRDPEISASIAAKLREFHNLDMPGLKNVLLWDRLRNWLNEAKGLCSPEHLKEFSLGNLEKEINLLEKELSTESQEIGFCHNDMQYGNIMINENTRAITIIDYEYAGYNPITYDFANHFCEMTANYHTETPHIMHFNTYPDIEERHQFIRAYLSSSGHQPSDEKVKKLADEAEKYTLANHLFWGLWGVISAYVNNIEFDYMEYARGRFEQYWLRKPELLGATDNLPHVNTSAEAKSDSPLLVDVKTCTLTI
ncbi:putative choline kinase 1 [Nicotiana tabacum]|uniref:Choline kinase 1 n=2 Tax=Nicotiana TaxID=4085 RepID=A0A1S3X909_TOBAC|nr:PREDICTED: probable choline kinase 1 [Nicotiana sylvestris]XP_016436294.1 PREDICTED: probable choline kinase 1 [Nicotiana tabacum]